MSLELYYYENSICAERALMTLAEKNVDDWVPHHISLFKRDQHNPEYLKINPKAQVPTLVHDGVVVRESSLICDYIDELYPQPALKPTGLAGLPRIEALQQTARMREWIKDCDEAGYQGVASLSFTAVFRGRLLGMSDADREAYWAGQTDIERSHRQQSCVFEGLESQWAIRALGSWDRMFGKMEATLADGRTWLMGDQFTLAEICYAPFIARLDGMTLLPVWLEDRPVVRAWWDRLSARPSFTKGLCGPTGDDAVTYPTEGAKIVAEARQKLSDYRARYG